MASYVIPIGEMGIFYQWLYDCMSNIYQVIQSDLLITQMEGHVSPLKKVT